MNPQVAAEQVEYHGVYVLGIAFVLAVCGIACIYAVAESRQRRRPTRSHEQRLLDVVLYGYGMGYASAHVGSGCPSDAHAQALADEAVRMILGDPIPRQHIADWAVASYDGTPDPHPEVTAIPLGHWGGGSR